MDALDRTTKTPERSPLTSINENDALAQAYVERSLTQQARHEALVGQREQLPEPVHPEPVIGEKVTSPELAKLASEYLSMPEDELDAKIAAKLNFVERAAFKADIRRLAASVLSQAEGGVK
jgi:hypothetical protein